MTAKKTTSSRASTSRKATASKATARRPAAKAAPKQPAAKKSAARKPAAKKPAAKKPAAKKPAAKKSAVRKPAAKKPAAARRSSKASAKPAATKPAASAVRSPARKRKPVSPFRVGDKVVYPHHGAAVIIKKERRDFNKSKVDFFVLEVAIDQLILRVPVESAAELGVRPVISKTAARKVLAVFRTEPEEAGANWSRWYKLLTEKIQSGDIYQVAEVVRDLTFAQQTKGISPALKRMLSKARLILASELRFVLDLSEEEAMKRLDKALPKVDSEEDE
jgi:CarD family transcriptional regulator